MAPVEETRGSQVMMNLEIKTHESQAQIESLFRGSTSPESGNASEESRSVEENVQYLVGFNPPEGSIVTSNQDPPCTTPTFPGTLEEFQEKYGINVWNDEDSKRCNNCGKTVSVKVSIICNGCNLPLGEDATPTHNALLGFVFGIASSGGKFGRKLLFSSRYEDPDVLVFDDALARSPIHFCAVPTKLIRTVQDLILRPDAREVLQLLEDASIKALDNLVTEEWLEKVNVPYEEIKESLIFGFNAQPSQFQLHLHCILPPFMPEDDYLTKTGVRFNHGRWLPLSYVKACIDIAEKVQLEPDFDIFTAFTPHGGPDYGEMLMDQRVFATTRDIKLWNNEWFTHRVIDNKVVDMDGNICEGTPAEWSQRDKRLIQNCGRPYVDGDMTPVSYFSHAKIPPEVEK